MNSRYLSEPELRQNLKRAILTEMPRATKIEIDKLYTQSPVPRGASLVSLHPRPPLGLVTFQFKLEGTSPIYGNATARVYLKIATAKTPIKNGDSFTEANVTFEERELSPLSQKGYFADRTDLGQIQANGYLHPGVALSSSNVKPIMTVTQGQGIQIVHRTKALEVTAQGRALESGRVGDWIRVENPTSRKIIRGRITQTGEVETR